MRHRHAEIVARGKAIVRFMRRTIDSCMSHAYSHLLYAELSLPATPLVMSLMSRPYLIATNEPGSGVFKVLLDSGSSVCVLTSLRGSSPSITRDPPCKHIKVGNPDAPVVCESECDLSLPVEGVNSTIAVLPEVPYLLAPRMICDVISTGTFLDEHDIYFNFNRMTALMPGGQSAEIYRHNALFYVHALAEGCDEAGNAPHGPATLAIVTNRAERHALLWSARLGGLTTSQASELSSKVQGLSHGIDDVGAAALEKCELDARALDHCELHVATRMRTPSLPCSSTDDVRASEPGERLVLDGWPLGHVPQVGTGKDYLLMGADDYSGFGCVTPTKQHTAHEWILFTKCGQAKHTLLNRNAKMLAVRTDGARANSKMWRDSPNGSLSKLTPFTSSLPHAITTQSARLQLCSSNLPK